MNRSQIMKWGMNIPTNFVVIKIRPSMIKLPIRKCIVCECQLSTNMGCSYCEHKLDEIRGGLD